MATANRDEAAPRSNISLVDYIVLEIIEQWDRLSRQDPSDFDDMAARQKALIIYAAGELVIRGYPLELALDFADPDVKTQIGDLVSSVGIDQSLAMLISEEFLAEPDRSVPHYFPTGKGRRALEFYLRDSVRRFDLHFNALPSAYFLNQNVQGGFRRYPPIVIGDYLADTVKQWYARPTVDFRLALLQIGVHFLRDKIAPRTYKFNHKYFLLTRNFAQRVLEERVRSR